jgi:hypothetical protein
VLGTSILLPMVVRVKVKAAVDRLWVQGVLKPPPTTVHELKTQFTQACANTTCGRRLNIGLMLLEPLVGLTMNFTDDKLLSIKRFQFLFELVRVL